MDYSPVVLSQESQGHLIKIHQYEEKAAAIFELVEAVSTWFHSNISTVIVGVAVSKRIEPHAPQTTDENGILYRKISKLENSRETESIFLSYDNDNNRSPSLRNQALNVMMMLSSTFVVYVTDDNEECVLEHFRYLQQLPSFLQQFEARGDKHASLNGAKPKHNFRTWSFLIIIDGTDETNTKVTTPEAYLKSIATGKMTEDEIRTVESVLSKYFPNRKCIYDNISAENDIKMMNWTKISNVVQTNITTPHDETKLSKEDGISACKEIIAHCNEIFRTQQCEQIECSEMDEITDKVVAAYKKHMSQELNSTLPVDIEILNKTHREACDLALNSVIVKSGNMLEKGFEEKLKEKCTEAYFPYVQENDLLSREKCLLLLQHLFAQIDENLERKEYSKVRGYEDYKQDRDVAVETYEQIPGKGPMAKHVLDEFLKNREVDEQRIKNPGKQFPEVMMYRSSGEMALKTHTQTICDTMYRSLDIHTSLDENNPVIGPQLIEFSIKAMSLEKQLKKYKILLQNKSDEMDTVKEQLEHRIEEKENEIFQLRKFISEMNQNSGSLTEAKNKPEHVTIPNSAESSIVSCDPSMPGKEWIHVVEEHKLVQQTDTVQQKKYTLDESTEREHTMYKSLEKKKKQIKDLVKANDDWAEHYKIIQEQHDRQTDILIRELKSSKQYIQQLQQQHEETTNLKNEHDEELKKLQHKHSNAVEFATSQASKLDGLKKDYMSEKSKVEELTDKVNHLTSVVDLQKEEIEGLNRENQELKETRTQQETQQNAVNLTENNEPLPPSYEETVHRERHNRHDLNSTENLKVENSVLKQQVRIYKDDFDNERLDRERAQSEIASLKIMYSQLTEDNRLLGQELNKKNTENEALKAAREEDRHQLQTKQETVNQLNRELRQSKDRNRNLNNEIQALKHKQEQYERQQRERNPPPYTFVPPQSGLSNNREQPRSNEGSPRPRRPPTAPSQSVLTEFLPREWSHQIQANYAKFHMHMRTENVVPRLYGQGVISYIEKQQIDAIGPEYKKTEYILQNVLMKGTKSDLRAFKQILVDTNQMDLAYCLPGPHNSVPVAKWSCTTCTFENEGLRTTCEVCGVQAPQSPRQRNSTFNQNQRSTRGRYVEECDADGDDEVDGIEWVKPGAHQTPSNIYKAAYTTAECDEVINTAPQSSHSNYNEVISLTNVKRRNPEFVN